MPPVVTSQSPDALQTPSFPEESLHAVPAPILQTALLVPVVTLGKVVPAGTQHSGTPGTAELATSHVELAELYSTSDAPQAARHVPSPVAQVSAEACTGIENKISAAIREIFIDRKG